MKAHIICFIALILLLAAEATSQESPFKEGDLIVQLKKGMGPDLITRDFRPIDLRSRKRLSARLNIWLFEYNPETADARQVLQSVRNSGSVVAAQFNHFVKERVLIPNDPQFGSQWALNNTGQTGGTPDADIDAPEAWDITTGGTTALGDQIVVAVIDGGVDLNHQDLAFFKNVHEIPGNSIDDDNNGYVDDYDGWNAYNSNGTIPSSSHGTHVSGIAAAKGNNSIGVSGVNWGAKVLPIAGSSGTESIVVEAYGYALEMRARYNETHGDSGAFIVSTNSSFGVDYGQPANFPIWSAMYDSMGAVGILSAAATANLNVDVDVVGDMPTACPSDWLVTVTNTTNQDLKNSGAAYGLTTIDLGSPGTSVLSTLPGNTYGNNTGTSMATPGVAGAIALMYAAANSGLIQAYRIDPAGIALQFKQWLLDGTDSIPSLTGITVTDGRLNAYKSVLLVQTYADALDPNAPTNLTAFSDYSTPTSMLLRWSNPTTLVNGQPIGPFVIRIRRNGLQITERPSPDSTYTDTGLIDGTPYTYEFQTRLTQNDSLSPVVETAWIAGGSKTPSAPTGLTVTGSTATGFTIRWSNPSRQIDGTLLDDFAGIRLYRDGSFLTVLTRTSADTSRADSTVDMAPAGFHSYYVTAVDNESPMNESSPSGLGFTPIGIPFADQFPIQGTPNPAVWISANVTVDNRGLNEPSEPYSLNLNGNPVGGGDSAVVRSLDLSGMQGSGLVLRYFYQPRGTGDNPEVADSLIVDFRNDLGQWIQVKRYPGLSSATPTPPYQRDSIAVDAVSPGGGTFFYDGFKFRFRSKGTTGAFDDWFVDDVSLGGSLGPPTMVLNNLQITDTVGVGTVDTTSYAFSISNNNPLGAPLAFTVIESPAVQWLAASPSSGSVAGSGSQTVRVFVDFGSVSPGAYVTQLFVNGNDPANTSDTVLVSFIVENAEVNISVNLDAGWNLISNPVTRPAGTDSVRMLFPNSQFNYAFSYVSGSGYEQALALPNGGGFWGKFPVPETNVITGFPRISDSVSVYPGWNLVGSISLPLDTSVITSVPGGLRSSVWFGYSLGYYPAGQILPGKAYWVKTSGAGYFIFSPSARPYQNNRHVAESLLEGLNTLTISESSGKAQVLYFGADPGDMSFEEFEMPPAPPSGVFDVRFLTEHGGSMVQTHVAEPRQAMDFPISVSTEYYPLIVSWNINVRDLNSSGASAYELVDGAGGTVLSRTPLEGTGSMRIDKGAVSRILLRVTAHDPLPVTYALDQNYPNPFNSATRIRVALPRESEVRLKVYNLLGQEVVTLVDEKCRAGYHMFEWNGANARGNSVGSGIYFFRLEANGSDGSFVRVRKMSILK